MASKSIRQKERIVIDKKCVLPYNIVNIIYISTAERRLTG